MFLLNNYDIIYDLIDKVQVDIVYPLSIIEGKQQGEVFVDNLDKPTVALFWHYCGFAYIAGKYDEKFLSGIIHMMKNPEVGHSGRLALQAGKEESVLDAFMKDCGIKKEEQYLFKFIDRNEYIPKVEDKYELVEINMSNYDMLSGRITPTFSWQSKEAFLENGFGYCLLINGKFAACSFSAGISNEYVDIGVETAIEYRGKGFGKMVAAAMVSEICNRGMIPVWECNTSNTASMKLACSIGFCIKDVHPLYFL